ncbi:NADH-quinone oxidoreductase subunit B family protein [Thermodesulfatator atlanticus]|uniref:NADH-quinone oxidoreductase subunit B family protein n=1 Tax=Thermodesulfatator atlanticus TaxID=501497 RepID=UPI0003B43788|nr:F420-non-reducing hydrogenase iron-sulfur subunit G [Thermodesulfatator atlanticus]
MSKDKIKLGVLLAGGCAGCEMAIVDLSERLIDALEHLEVVFWAPTVADVKYKDLESMPDGSIDVALVDGMVRLDEHEHMLKVLRAKSKVLVAFGSCASEGCIPGMSNLFKKEELLEHAYKNTFSTDNPEGILPQPEWKEDGKYDLTLPRFLDEVRPISSVVEVDYFMGGCPPHPDFVGEAIGAIIEGKLPPKGSWITCGKAVCDFCGRNPALQGKKRELTTEVRRTFEGAPDDGRCLLEQGYICFGPFTQGDCKALCPKVGIPCRGCGGPLPGVKDYGAKAVSALGTMLTDEAVDQLLKKYPNLVQFIYRYSYPSSLLNKK